MVRLLRILGRNDEEASDAMNDVLAQVFGIWLLIIVYRALEEIYEKCHSNHLTISGLG